MACGDVPTDPMEVLAGPCSGPSSNALFTVANVSQSTPYPGCQNTITVEFKSSIPLYAREHAKVVIKFDASLSIGAANGRNLTLAGGDAARFTDVDRNATSQAEWRSNSLVLRVAEGQDLEPCVLYVVTFTVPNPFPVAKQMAMPVHIGASTDNDRVLIDLMPMKMDSGALSTLPGTAAGDEAPFTVHPALFLKKDIFQATPYPGHSNVLTVKVGANTGTSLRSVGFLTSLELQP